MVITPAAVTGTSMVANTTAAVSSLPGASLRAQRQASHEQHRNDSATGSLAAQGFRPKAAVLAAIAQ